MTPPGNQTSVPYSPHSSTLEIKQFSGPLPPPQILQEYNRVVPGAAERLLVMAEEQARHRRELERRVVRWNTVNETLGILSAIVVVCGAFAWATYAVYTGQSAKGSAVVISTIATLAGIFIYGKERTSQERLARHRGAEARTAQKSQ